MPRIYKDGVLYNTSPSTASQLPYDSNTSTKDKIDSKADSSSLNNKMDKANPTGIGSLSLNRKENTTVGYNSTTEGSNCTASGSASHAEGYSTTASGNFSHAEGASTTASGNDSHAEGYSTTTSNTASHAEGYRTTASNTASHAEGYSTTASGSASHAEGYSTTASGNDSHAEGSNTIANHLCQHVFGEYNLEDVKAGAGVGDRGNYIEIVGKGTGNNSRSNARTLDWNGNEVLAGDLTIKGSISVESGITLRRLMYEATSGNLSQKTFTASTGHFAGSDRNVNTGMYVIQVHGWSTSPKYAIFTAGFSGGRTDNLNISQLLNIGSVSAPTVSGGVITFAASTYSKIIVYALD